MKKAFSLIELLVSVVLFSIILFFLYNSLSVTKTTNIFYEKKLDEKKEITYIKKLLYEDIALATKVDLSLNVYGYYILKLETKNLYHNPFYKHVTYLVSNEKNLFRIESFSKFNEKELLDSFFNQAYVDLISNNIVEFKIKQQKNRIYTLFYKKKDKKAFFFNVLRLNNF